MLLRRRPAGDGGVPQRVGHIARETRALQRAPECLWRRRLIGDGGEPPQV